MTLAAENGRLRGREEMRERIVALTQETTRIQARLLVTQVQLDTLQTTLRLNAAVAALVAEKEPQQLAEVLKLLQQSIEDQAAKMTNEDESQWHDADEFDTFEQPVERLPAKRKINGRR
jgi:hypothetical protein